MSIKKSIQGMSLLAVLLLLGAGCTGQGAVESDTSANLDAEADGEQQGAQVDSSANAEAGAALEADLRSIDANIDELDAMVEVQMDSLAEQTQEQWAKTKMNLMEGRAEAMARIEAFVNASADERAQMYERAEAGLDTYMQLYEEARADLQTHAGLEFDGDVDADVDARAENSETAVDALEGDGGTRVEIDGEGAVELQY